MSKETKWDKLFYAIPGAWYGSDQSENYPAHVVIDAAKTAGALAFLRRHRCKVLATGCVVCDRPYGDGGLRIEFEY